MLEAELDGILDALTQANWLYVLDRRRPYDGQAWTELGERGKQEIHGITMRDLRDCFIRGCYDASGLPPEKYPQTIFELPWEEMNLMAVCQNMLCWIEKYMGIFPNIPPFSEEEIWTQIPLIELPSKREE